MANEPTVPLAITEGGPGLYIAALVNGKIQVANSWRPLTAAERQLAHERDIPSYFCKQTPTPIFFGAIRFGDLGYEKQTKNSKDQYFALYQR